MSTTLARVRRAIHRRPDPSGQVLVIVAAALIGLIAMVGLVIDGGYAWGRQRVQQNGADAIAKAGAVVILEWLDEKPKTIGDVGCAVETARGENEVDIDEVQFTDHDGRAHRRAGPRLWGGGRHAAQGPGNPCGGRADVRHVPYVRRRHRPAHRQGQRHGHRAGRSPDPVGLPVTFPQTMDLCDESGDTWTIRDWNDENPGDGDAGDNIWTPYEILPTGATLNASNLAIIPLCTTGPGSVGWLDFGCGNLADQINDPCDIFANIPGWVQAHTGNINCCEGELSEYNGDEPGVYEETASTTMTTSTCR